jgi:glucose-1-phosphate adenylyltransferase
MRVGMIKKEMIAMLLAGGQGSRLGILTSKMAKPAVCFGGKYRIIDFPLSNCVNSGIDTVGVLTQYRPLKLNTHIGIGIPWDLDRNVGGVTVLPPYEKMEDTEWYTGTANAIYQNIDYIETYNPDYVLILSGDHIYKMDYETMLDYHKEKGADVTIAVMPVPMEEAKRFGIMVTNEDSRITDFEEKPEHPRSNLASMGIYIFSWPVLKEALLSNASQPGLDFGKHIIPYCRDQGKKLYAYEFNGYWKDVGTLTSYWQANMELIDVVPEFNLYEEYWKIYTRNTTLPPQYFGPNSSIERSIVGEGSEIYGQVINSVIGTCVTIGEGTVVRDSIIMNDTVIGGGGYFEKAIVAESAVIGNGVRIGEGAEVPNETAPNIYRDGLTVVGEKSHIPDGVSIGKNALVSGDTAAEDFPGGCLESGKSLVKAGDQA